MVICKRAKFSFERKYKKSYIKFRGRNIIVKPNFLEDWDLHCQEIFKNENKYKQARLKIAGHSQSE